MDFMKKDKVDRKLEREEDLEFFREYIIEGVKEQVEEAIKPLQERQSKLEQKQCKLEQEQVIMQGKFLNLLQEVKDMKEKSRCEEVFPVLSPKEKSSLAKSGSTKFRTLDNTIQNNLSKSADPELKEKQKIAS